MGKFIFDLQRFASSSIATSDPNLVQQGWARTLTRSTQDELWWNKFIGKTADYIITKNTDLKKEAGDKITVPLLSKLIGPGITGDNWAEGNEEPQAYYDFPVNIDQIRKAVEIKGKMDQQKTQIDMRAAACSQLTTWLAEENIDQGFFNVMSTNPSPNRIIRAGGRSANDLIQTGDTMSCALISSAKRMATLAGNPVPVTTSGGTVTISSTWNGWGQNQVTGAGTNFTNDFLVGDVITINGQSNYIVSIESTTVLNCAAQWLTSVGGASYTAIRWIGGRSKIRPVNVNGGKFYVMVIHPNQERDLQDDPKWLAYNQSNVAWKEADNPIFKGCAGVYMGVVIQTHDRVVVNQNGLNGIQTASALFLGAQAGVMAVAEEPTWYEKRDKDYGNRLGVCTGMIYGVAKSTFNGEDYATITVNTAAVNDMWV